MRVPNEQHEARPWVLPRIAPDFELMDVWALPVEGSREQLTDVLEVFADLDPASSGSQVSQLLFTARLLIGRLLGWDDGEPRPIPGCTETTLIDRLPAELRGTATSPALDGKLSEAAGGFVPLFRTDDEWAAEISNATVHGVMQITWVPYGARYRAHLAVYVKPRGALGRAYLKLIDPFRHRLVYPSMLRHVGRRWAAAAPGHR